MGFDKRPEKSKTGVELLEQQNHEREREEEEAGRLNGEDVRTFTVSVSKLYLLYNALCISCAMEKKMIL